MVVVAAAGDGEPPDSQFPVAYSRFPTMNFRTIALALFVIGFVWLGVMVAFVMSGLQAGKLEGLAPAILGIGFFGLIPALLFGTVGAVLWRQYNMETRQRRDISLREEVLQRVMTRGRCKLDDLAQELGVPPKTIEEAIYDLVGMKLFTGYVNWPGREIIAMEAEQISGDKCPNCGGAIELAGKSMARCPHCGTQVFLPLPKG